MENLSSKPMFMSLSLQWNVAFLVAKIPFKIIVSNPASNNKMLWMRWRYQSVKVNVILMVNARSVRVCKIDVILMVNTRTVLASTVWAHTKENRNDDKNWYTLYYKILNIGLVYNRDTRPSRHKFEKMIFFYEHFVRPKYTCEDLWSKINYCRILTQEHLLPPQLRYNRIGMRGRVFRSSHSEMSSHSPVVRKQVLALVPL